MMSPLTLLIKEIIFLFFCEVAKSLKGSEKKKKSNSLKLNENSYS
jgi:hypothetical protein